MEACGWSITFTLPSWPTADAYEQIPGNVVTSDKRIKVHKPWIRHIEKLGNQLNFQCNILTIYLLFNAIKGILGL
jgi:hypothetical protein